MTAKNSMRGIVVTLAVAACGSTAVAADLPLNPDVTQATVITTICQAVNRRPKNRKPIHNKLDERGFNVNIWTPLLN